MILGYQVRADLTKDECDTALYDLFADPIIETASHDEALLSSFDTPPDLAIQVGFKPESPITQPRFLSTASQLCSGTTPPLR